VSTYTFQFLCSVKSNPHLQLQVTKIKFEGLGRPDELKELAIMRCTSYQPQIQMPTYTINRGSIEISKKFKIMAKTIPENFYALVSVILLQILM